MMKSFYLFLLLVNYAISRVGSKDLEYQFVAVVFRHGDRAPDRNSEMFPNDPYYNYSFYPMGLGGLTNTGKKRLYNLGGALRKRYNKFLDDIYNPSDIIARSTDYDRTKMSLQLVLAALYPPKKSQIWNSDLKWQPIATNAVPSIQDNLMVAELCPRYLEERERVSKLPEVVREVKKFQPLMEKLTYLTGKVINTTYDFYNLYHSFVAESTMNLTLPDWAQDLFPYGALYDGILLEYKISNYNKQLKKLFGGMLLKNILDTMKTLVENNPKNGSKIHLFSGHETNIVSLLNTLEVFEPHVPRYGSAIILELLADNMDFYVAVHYNTADNQFKKLLIPDCSDPCPFSKFLKLFADVIPTDEEIICIKTKIYESAPAGT